MSPSSPLTSGAISHIYRSRDTTGKPVLQVMDLKKLTNGGSNQRYRLSLSDGTHFQQAMLATQLNHLMSDHVLHMFCIVRLSDFIVQDVSGKVILIVLNLDVIQRAPTGGLIGSPISAAVLGTSSSARPMPQRPLYRADPDARPSTAGGIGWGRTSDVSETAPSGALSQVDPGGAVSQVRGGGISEVLSPSRFRDIQAINPYQTGWAIRGRCTYKSDMRRFQNARGEGTVISFELMDQSGSIRCTAFTERAQEVQDNVHLGRVYCLARAQLKQANEKYNRSTSSFELTLDLKSVLREDQDDGTVAPIRYKFTKICDLEKIEVKSTCDVVAVIHDIGELSEVLIRSTGEPCKKRSLTLIDDSGATVELTLWRGNAETLVTDADRDRHPTIVVRNASRGDFGGVCLNMNRSTTVELDPVEVPEAHAVRTWYDSGGASNAAIQSLTQGIGSGGGGILGERKTLTEAQEKDLSQGFSAGSVVFVMRGYVTFVKKDKELSYPSDPTTKKKVIETSTPGVWHSESSRRDFSEDEIVHRYICSMKVADCSSAQWMNTFDEGGQVIFGKTAGEMRTLRASNEPAYDGIIDDCYFRPLVLKVSVKEDDYGGETRIRYTIMRCEKTDFVKESRVLLSEIAAYDA